MDLAVPYGGVFLNLPNYVLDDDYALSNCPADLGEKVSETERSCLTDPQTSHTTNVEAHTAV